MIEKAKVETAFLFGAAGLPIVWAPCRDFQGLAAEVRESLFIIRVRTAPKGGAVGKGSLERLGQAFFAEDGGALIADAYIDLIQQTATLNGMEEYPLLGCVIAHEMGHLLLGPQHGVTGLMLPTWHTQQLQDIEKRRLKFSRPESARLRRACDKLRIANGPAHRNSSSAGT